jgi:aspartate/methionine/tyrosine aminotransferase
MPANIAPFQAIGISRLAHQLKAQGGSIVHMEFGQPSTGAPAAAIAAAHRLLDTSPMGYWESQELKARIGRHYRDTYDVAVAPEQVLLTCGASPALVLALISSFDPGARVALARPGYVAYRNNLRALHMQPVEIACGADVRYQLTAAAVAALDPVPDGLIVASPANPTGTIIGDEELRAIVRVCHERGIRIISDEIYHGLSYVAPAASVLQFEPRALVVNSFSKYFSMVGWRLGWLVVPPDHVERARAYIGNMFLTAPSLSQHAALAAMDAHGELQGHLDVYRRNRALLLEALPSMGLQAIAPPDGAFYIYADVAHLTYDSMAFCTAMLRETGVAIAPGVDFDPVDGTHCIRMSFAAATADIEEAIRRLRPWFTQRPGAPRHPGAGRDPAP